MAKVYRAKDLNLGREVALKVLLDSVAQDPEFRERFRREARASAALTHPNIVQVYDFFESPQGVFIVMELIEGQDLHAYLEQKGPLAPAEAVRIVLDVLSALEFAHSRGVVHRDITARNVLLARDGSVHVTDFGIAQVVGERTLTQSGELIGSVQYISPEQASGQHATPRTDIYSTGVLLYVMLVGELPFSSDNVVKLALMHVQAPVPKPSLTRSDIPEALENIILKAMAKDPAQRFQSASEMMDALHSWQINPLRRSTLVPGQRPPAPAAPFSNPPPAPTLGKSVAAAPTAVPTAPQAPAPGGGTVLHARLPQNLLKMQEDAARSATPVGNFSDQEVQDTVDLSTYPEEEPLQEGGEEGEDYQDYADEYPLEEGAEGEGEGEGMGSKGLGAIIAISLTIFLAFVAGLTWVNLTATSKVNIPNVVGQDVERAKTIVQEAGMRLEIRSQKYLANERPGLVLEQDPAGGVQSAGDGVVWVDISVGRERATIPNLQGLREGQACAELEKLGLGYTVVPRESRLEAGTVFGQHPLAGQEVVTGTEVTIFVSVGQGQLTVPTLTGLTLGTAYDLVGNLGLNIKVKETKVDPHSKAETILSQEPSAGLKVAKGQTIYVVISRKEERKQAPALVGKTLGEAKKIARGMGIELEVSGDTSDQALVSSQKINPGSILSEPKLGVRASLAKPTVPDVCTQTYERAVETLKAGGWKVGKVSVVEGETSNIVVQQYPGPAQEAAPGSSVDLTVTRAVAAQPTPAVPAPPPVPAPSPVDDRAPLTPAVPAPPPVPQPEQPLSEGIQEDLDIELPGDLP